MNWNPEWTGHWHYYPDGRRLRIDPRAHLIHRLGDTPGIDVGVYAFWKQRGVPVLRFGFRPGRTLNGAIGLVAAFATFDLVKMPFDAGADYGEQWVAPADAAVWHPVHTPEEAEATIAGLMALSYGAA